MAERTTIRLPEELVRRAKIMAASEGRSFTALIEESLRRALDDRQRSSREPPRVLPPVSPVIGALAPGIDLDNSAVLQEMDDLDYVARFR